MTLKCICLKKIYLKKERGGGRGEKEKERRGRGEGKEEHIELKRRETDDVK